MGTVISRFSFLAKKKKAGSVSSSPYIAGCIAREIEVLSSTGTM
jgi:hypothetical protein